MADIASQLRGANACARALEWAAGFDNFKDAWNGCERGDWLLWFAHILDVQPQLVTQVAFACERVRGNRGNDVRRREMADIVRQRIPWGLVAAKIKIVDGALVRKIRR